MKLALTETRIPGLPKRSGKVRDVYDLGDHRLLLVATDRISAFDWILPAGIPDKGKILTAISQFWFGRLKTPNHDLGDYRSAGLGLPEETLAQLEGRTTLVRKVRIVPFECVVRGYLSGSGWKEYRATGGVCGERLPAGLTESDAIEPIFTPATKAEEGHDENVSFARMADTVGSAEARELRDRSLALFLDASHYARSRGLILADTKFEWGRDVATGELLLADEALTPDSSRYWDAAGYRPGGPQPSFDKQFVRDWLETTGWDKASPPPFPPDEIIVKTREKYVQAYKMLTGLEFPHA